MTDGFADDWTETERVRHQRGLGIRTDGDDLHQREIEFLERFLALGHLITWIPRDTRHFQPTHDFSWVGRGDQPFELKSTKARYQTITAAVAKAIYRAKKHGVIKDRFVVNLGTAELTPELARALTTINANRADPIAELWVLSAFHLAQIELAV